MGSQTPVDKAIWNGSAIPAISPTLNRTFTVPPPPPSAGLAVRPIRGLPLIQAGDDLSALLIAALDAQGDGLQDGDVLVAAQKIVSKAEGRTRALASVTPGAEAEALAARTGKPAALVELILSEAAEVMRAAPGVIIVRHTRGHVLANAGVDASNVRGGDAGEVLLWPCDPDASAARLREALQTRYGVRIAVIISDSLGRAWRIGTMGTAIGSAGLKPVRDRRGERDLFGRVLLATQVAVVDEIAAAASLVIGEGAEGTPAAIVRGATFEPDETAGVGAVIRPLAEDLFR